MPDLPPPLPPGERTVGQLVAETIRAYGHRFWGALPLGIRVAVADQFSVREAPRVQMLVYWAATPLFVWAFVWACKQIHGRKPTKAAVVAAVLIYLPFPALRAVTSSPGSPGSRSSAWRCPQRWSRASIYARRSCGAGSWASPTTRMRSARSRRS